MSGKEATQENFKPIVFTQKDVADKHVSRYRVYRSHNDYIVVTAENAQVALEKCGITDPLRLLKDDLFLDNVVSLPSSSLTTPHEEVMETEAAVAAEAVVTEVATTEAAADAPEPAAPEVAVPAAEAELTSDEVNKLLNQ